MRNLAILSTKKGAYSNSFIDAHRSLKADNVQYIYGGLIPTLVDGQELTMGSNPNYLDSTKISAERRFQLHFISSLLPAKEIEN